MANHHPENERIKRRYFAYLREAKGRNEATLDAVAKALSRFEEYTNFKPFTAFHVEQAQAFKRALAKHRSSITGEPLSKSTLYSTLQALKAFVIWLADQPGCRARVRYSDAEYFNLSEKETRIAKAYRHSSGPTIEQINRVLGSMPQGGDIEQRNRALIAFAILTGARDGALASLKLKHVDLVEGLVFQDARDVRTKASKTFTTWFFPIGGPALEIFAAWIAHLRNDLFWGDDDPIFPSTRIIVGASRQFEASGLDRKAWSNATPIRRIFRDAFGAVDLPYFNPHSFRKTLVQLGERLCRTPEELKAWSQNLGHESVLTTFASYGAVAPSRQACIIKGLGSIGETADDQSLPDLLARAAHALARRAATGTEPAL